MTSHNNEGAEVVERWVDAITSGVSPPTFRDIRTQAERINRLPRALQEELEASLARRLAVFGQSSRDVFQAGLAWYQAQPAFAARTSTSVGYQQFSTPLPLSVAAQHVLGAAMPLAHKRVLEPTIGNGSLVALLGAADVYGVEIDPVRLEQAKQMRAQPRVSGATHCVLGDATQVRFSEVDLVISNPPFGKVRPVNYLGLRVTRLDHLILMRALEARAPRGLAVFIIGADSALDRRRGEVSGGSRYLFNWLADHYRVEDVVEIEGDLYSRQGAAFPVRMVVLGDASPSDQPVPDRLPVISSYEELWTWAAGLRERLCALAAPEESPPMRRSLSV